uniref:Immunoglobulin subtype domain-containing protein n=1 Tax=Oreochromis niloticus TaxID=8128 RepID=A0A669CU90_ORENI
MKDCWNSFAAVNLVVRLDWCLQHVFVLHGKDLHLDTEKPVKLDEQTDLFWKCNSSNNIAKCVFNRDPFVYKKYAGRAELFGQNCSLKLKKVQHSDSGDYKAVVVGEQEQRVAEYKVIVQVAPADLTVDPVSTSSDSCNLTVTCSTVDFNISSSFRCDGKICSHAGEKDVKATTKFSSLSVYLHQDTIFCNHSNQVSWNQTMKVLKSYCETETAEITRFLKDLLCDVCMLSPCLTTCLFIVIESIHNPVQILECRKGLKYLNCESAVLHSIRCHTNYLCHSKKNPQPTALQWGVTGSPGKIVK